jgi:hypothetical protein
MPAGDVIETDGFIQPALIITEKPKLPSTHTHTHTHTL